MKKRVWLCFAVFGFLLSIAPVSAAEVQQVETQGIIGFTGKYEPIGTPDPAPPESIERPPIKDVTKPDRSLPQTNIIINRWLVWLGISILGFVFLGWKRKN